MSSVWLFQSLVSETQWSSNSMKIYKLFWFHSFIVIYLLLSQLQKSIIMNSAEQNKCEIKSDMFVHMKHLQIHTQAACQSNRLNTKSHKLPVVV